MNKLTEIIKASTRLLRGYVVHVFGPRKPQPQLFTFRKATGTKCLSSESGSRTPQQEAYFASHESFLQRPNYKQALQLAFNVVEYGVTANIVGANGIEDLELAQEMFVAFSREIEADPDVSVIVYDSKKLANSGVLSGALKILDGTSPPPGIFGRDEPIFRNLIIQLLATLSSSLAPQIAALRIQHDMKQRIDAGTAIPGAEAAIEAPVGTRRRMGKI